MRKTTIILMTAVLGACAVMGGERPLAFVSGDGPVYPRQAKAQGVEGYVVLEYDVTAAGSVTDVRVVEAEPDGVFDEAALAAIRGWKYRARIEDGVRVATPNVRSTLTFRLGYAAQYPER